MHNEQTERLQQFVDAAKNKGASDEFLSAFLSRRGWPLDEVYSALGSYWERSTGIPVPERAGSSESARDAFLYLLSFATLATWSTSLGALIFSFIDHWLPDPVARGYASSLRTTLSWEMARVAIAFPVFLLVTRLTVREARKFPDRLQSGVRKWLTYIALLGTAGTMICDLIWFLNNLLAGEITARFLLKSATVMIIAGMIFVYYLSSLRSPGQDMSRAKLRNLTFAAAATLAVTIAFCIGLLVAGTPSEQRRFAADDVRIRDLRTIGNAINGWYNRASLRNSQPAMPPNLAALVQSGNLTRAAIEDPETHAPYTYEPGIGTRYELCAEFISPEQPDRPMRVPHSEFWHYGKGHTCYVLDASQPAPW